MRAVDIIIKKRDGQELTRPEIDYFVQGFTDGEIPDYQVAAWAMAVLLRGMTPRETTDLTLAMANSGVVLDLSSEVDIVVDKHSSGGVGDKTSLVVLPVVTSCGLPVGKMSGRGLGFSGGTLDKLESIPGFRCDLTTEEFKRQLSEIGVVLSGQSVDLAPADGKLYALRDVTGTVQSIPLIASSIMSKKIAGGAHAIVLDVKVGLGAFMQSLQEGRQLASLMVDIGRLAGRQVVTLLSDMNQPLGQAVGNTLEVKEALFTLQDQGPPDFREHCLQVSAHMLVLGRRAPDLGTARQMAEAAIRSGNGLNKFHQLVHAQGGDTEYLDRPEKFPPASYIDVIEAGRGGFLRAVNARVIGEASVALGAGRAKKSDRIDHAVGFIVHARVGDEIQVGQPLFTVHANGQERGEAARRSALAALEWSDSPVQPLPLFYDQ